MAKTDAVRDLPLSDWFTKTNSTNPASNNGAQNKTVHLNPANA
jgi:hypothetical protein